MHLENIIKLARMRDRLGKEKAIIDRKLSVIDNLILTVKFMHNRNDINRMGRKAKVKLLDKGEYQ